MQRPIERAESIEVISAASNALAGLGTRDSFSFLGRMLERTGDPAERKTFTRAIQRIEKRLANERRGG